MTIQTAAGASLAVCASLPATYNQAGYEALTFSTVGEVSNIGPFGREYELVTWNPLATRGTKKLKGTFNNGSLTIGVGLDPDDAGQTIMKAAANSDAEYAFRVTLQDGTIYYMAGMVMMFRPNVGEVNSIVQAECMIEVGAEAIVEVAAP